MLKAIIYTRVSTGQQAEEGTSLETQEAACLRKAQEFGAAVIDIISDEGVSGALYLSRPGIQKALSAIEASEADLLITMKLDRSGRNVDALRLIRKRVTDAGGKLVFADGMNFENNAIGNLMFTQIAGYAEYEKEIIRERTMSGRRRRAEEGQQPSRARSPYGYQVVTKRDVIAGLYPGNLLGTYQIIPAEAEIVREIFRRYSEGASLESICRHLQQSGVPTPRDGNYWRRCTIQRLLKNPVYMGKPAFGKYQAKTDETRAKDGRKVSFIVPAEEHNRVYLEAPALVEETTFAYCEERLSTGRPLRTGNPDRVHVLAGLIHCPLCGKRLKGKWIKRTYKTKDVAFDHFYQCQDSCPSSNPGRVVCSGQNYRADHMESLTSRVIEAVTRQPELVEKALLAYSQRTNADQTEAERKTLQKALQDLQAREKATIEAQITGIMAGASASTYTGILSQIAKEREQIETRITLLAQNAVKRIEPKKTANLLAQMYSDVEEALTSAELLPSERRQLFGTVVYEVVPKQDEEGEWGVAVTLRSPSSSADKEGVNHIVSMISIIATVEVVFVQMDSAAACS